MSKRGMTVEDALDLARARVSQIQDGKAAERDAIRALIHWRRLELAGAAPDLEDWRDSLAAVRDVADRLIEHAAYDAAEFAATQIVLSGGRPCGHRDEDACEACTDVPAPLLENRRDEVARRAEWDAAVERRANELAGGAS